MSTPVSSSLRARSIETAKTILSQKPIYLDTETTGLNADDEIVEISIIDSDGAPLIESLVKPTKPIPPDATRIHGITNEDIQSARTWPALWPEVRSALFGRVVVIYNVEFDLRLMMQSHRRYNLQWKERLNTFDLLKLYSEYQGEWDPRRRSYRYHSLDAAGKQCGISLPNAHRATADTLLTRALLYVIAGEAYQ
jgi:DNA polymerase-3 subunit epsilon